MPSKKGDSDQRLEENWSIMNTDDCQDDTETPEIIVDDVESVLSESRWEWAEDNGSVGRWQDEPHEQCSVSHGTLAWRSHKALSLQSSPHKEYCPQSLEITTWNQIHSYMSHTEILIESKRFIWTGCISAEQNDWHKSLNKRLMNHSFFINFFWWSCRDRISKQSKCILEKAETQDESLRLLKIRTGPKILWVFNQLGPGNLDWDWSIIHLN